MPQTHAPKEAPDAIAAVLLGMLLHRVHGMAEMAPGDAIHNRLRGTRC